MMGRTHLLLGINILWILEPLSGASKPLADSTSFALAVASASLGALLPDLDASTSLLQNVAVGGFRPLAPPGRFVNRTFGHRGFLHSFLALTLCALLALPLVAINPGIWLGLILGYLSHILGDACTRSGLRLFYPNRRVIYLLPRHLRMATGSQVEEALFAVLAAGAMCLLLRHLLQG